LGITPISLRAGGVQHTIKKLSMRATSQLKVYMQNYGPPKVMVIPIVRISRLPLGSLRTKCDLDVGIMESHRVYYKGKEVASPKSGLW